MDLVLNSHIRVRIGTRLKSPGLFFPPYSFTNFCETGVQHAPHTHARAVFLFSHSLPGASLSRRLRPADDAKTGRNLSTAAAAADFDPFLHARRRRRVAGVVGY